MTRNISSAADSGIVSDMEIIGNLNIYIGNLTDIYLKRYQNASKITNDVYTAFAKINISISQMISTAIVDSENNTIELDIKVLRDAINQLERDLFQSGPIVNQLNSVTFPLDMKAMADELVEGTGLIVVGGPPAEFFHLAVDRSSFDNLRQAFASLADPANQVSNNPDRIKVPSGKLQAFQTAVESINNKVSTDSQTMLERLRNVTTSQQQTTQLLSSLMKEIFESNKNFISRIN